MKHLPVEYQPEARVTFVRWFPALQHLCVCETGSPVMKVYNQQLRLLARVHVRLPMRDGVRAAVCDAGHCAHHKRPRCVAGAGDGGRHVPLQPPTGSCSGWGRR